MTLNRYGREFNHDQHVRDFGHYHSPASVRRRQVDGLRAILDLELPHIPHELNRVAHERRCRERLAWIREHGSPD
jgi:hypothetical protein